MYEAWNLVTRNVTRYKKLYICPYVLNQREYDENGMYSENVFNFPTTMTEQVTSLIVVTGAVLALFKRGLRWGRNFEGQFGGRHQKRAVQRDTYVLIKHLFYDRGKLQKILTKLPGHRTPRPRTANKYTSKPYRRFSYSSA